MHRLTRLVRTFLLFMSSCTAYSRVTKKIYKKKDLKHFRLLCLSLRWQRANEEHQRVERLLREVVQQNHALTHSTADLSHVVQHDCPALSPNNSASSNGSA